MARRGFRPWACRLPGPSPSRPVDVPFPGVGMAMVVGGWVGAMADMELWVLGSPFAVMAVTQDRRDRLALAGGRQTDGPARRGLAEAAQQAGPAQTILVAAAPDSYQGRTRCAMRSSSRCSAGACLIRSAWWSSRTTCWSRRVMPVEVRRKAGGLRLPAATAGPRRWSATATWRRRHRASDTKDRYGRRAEVPSLGAGRSWWSLHQVACHARHPRPPRQPTRRWRPGGRGVTQMWTAWCGAPSAWPAATRPSRCVRRSRPRS